MSTANKQHQQQQQAANVADQTREEIIRCFERVFLTSGDILRVLNQESAAAASQTTSRDSVSQLAERKVQLRAELQREWVFFEALHDQLIVQLENTRVIFLDYQAHRRINTAVEELRKEEKNNRTSPKGDGMDIDEADNAPSSPTNDDLGVQRVLESARAEKSTYLDARNALLGL